MYLQMKKTIIYVLEDDADIGELMEIILDEYEIHVFPNISKFNQAVLVKLPSLFLLDIMLPDGSGLDVCKSLKSGADTQNIPIILLSASYSTGTAEHAGADAFVSKPFDIYELKQQVDHWMAANA